MINKFAERLKLLRTSNNISQRQLAREVGFSQASIARWEKSTQRPTDEVIIAFAKYFQVSADYLLGLEDY